MGIDSRWNTGASFPISSLTPEELKEAIHEWAEGYDELEDLLWTCYQSGLETAGADAHEHRNYFEFYIEESSAEQAKRLLSAVEAYGFGQIFVTFGGNPYSGPNWHRTSFDVSCLRPEDVRTFFTCLARAVENENFEKTHRSFELVADFARFFEDKMTGISLRANVRNHSEYEFFIESHMNQRNWAYFDELLGSLGMNCLKSEKDPSTLWWQLRASSAEEFSEAMKRLAEGVRTKWSLPVPTEPTDDMGWAEASLIMRQKFGTTREGLNRLNDWINTTYPRKDGRKVNY